MEPWIPILAALIGALFVITNTVVSRSTARDIAALGAQQKRRDLDLTVLNTYGDALLNASNAVQSYVWFSDDHLLEKFDVPKEKWLAAQPQVDRTVGALERLRFLSGSLPTSDDAWADVHAAHTKLMDLLDLVTRVTYGDTTNGRDSWNAAIGIQPDPIVQAMDAVNALKRTLVDQYPIAVPDSIGARFNSVLHPKRTDP